MVLAGIVLTVIYRSSIKINGCLSYSKVLVMSDEETLLLEDPPRVRSQPTPETGPSVPTSDLHNTFQLFKQYMDGKLVDRS